MKIGTKVRLKSGGPVMTVEQLHAGTDQITCSWFDSRGRCDRRNLHKDTLELVENTYGVPVVGNITDRPFFR